MIYVYDIFEILINFFQAFLAAFFVYNYLSGENVKSFFKSSGISFGIVLAVSISIFNKIMAFESFYAIIYCLILFIYSAYFFKNKFLKKVFASVFPVFIILFSTAIISNAFAFVLDKSINKLISENSIERIIVIISIQLVAVYITFLSLKLLKRSKPQDLSRVEWTLIISIFLITICVCSFLIFISMDNITVQTRFYISVSMFLLLIVNIIIFYFIIDISNKNYKMQENEILKLEQQYYSQLIKSSKSEYDLIKKIRHDTKQNYNTLYDLIRDDKKQNALEYIKSINIELEKKEIYILTQNDVVNSIVNSKLTEAKSLGIEVICLSVDNISGITDYDLLRLLSNMLDNAIYATKENVLIKKQIRLQIDFDGCAYRIVVKNTVDYDVLEKNPKLLTSKSKKSEHGYGISIIREIVNKYHGNLDFHMDDIFFCCSAIINPVEKGVG